MRNVACSLWLAISLGALPLDCFAQAKTVFSGIPSQKISEAGTERRAESVARPQATNLGCVISEIDGKYYWATRANKEMVRLASGAFVTYIAVDGSGYVRVIDSNAKSAASAMSPTEARFDYTEHLLLGLRSVTYYGNAQ